MHVMPKEEKGPSARNVYEGRQMKGGAFCDQENPTRGATQDL